MSTIVNELRKGFYLDSVALMRMSAEISAMGGIEEAVLMIGTPSNLQIMKDAGVLTSTGETAGPNDLVIALRADGKSNANRALAQANKSLEGGALKSTVSSVKARTLRGAFNTHTDANLALISTPGSYAAREARTAIELGLNVMIFSDNVSIEQEASLKALAREKELLVMGPDCGTAYLNGVPLAFANDLKPVTDSTSKVTAVIAASGTGLQEFAVLQNKLGGRLKHGIGVGGRDLSDSIGGASTLTAIDLLAADDSIEQLVLISKPPGTDTAKRVFAKLSQCKKPVIACVLGQAEQPVDSNIQYADTLSQAAELATGKTIKRAIASDSAKELAAHVPSTRQTIRGLYSGGTLCTESQLILQRAGLNTASNAPAPGSQAIDQAAPGTHQLIDLGADEYTIGRPHPMMEPMVRIPAFEAALTDTSVAVVLLDIVLGYGAHSNPTLAITECLDTFRSTSTGHPLVIASMCGTESDPQNLLQQHDALKDSGVIVCSCNREAALLSIEIIDQLT